MPELSQLAAAALGWLWENPESGGAGGDPVGALAVLDARRLLLRSMSQENVEIVSRAIAAINDRDVDAIPRPL